MQRLRHQQHLGKYLPDNSWKINWRIKANILIVSSNIVFPCWFADQQINIKSDLQIKNPLLSTSHAWPTRNMLNKKQKKNTSTSIGNFHRVCNSFSRSYTSSCIPLTTVFPITLLEIYLGKPSWMISGFTLLKADLLTNSTWCHSIFIPRQEYI